MGFKCGVVGLPNVGKSTFFNAISQAGAAADNYAFCTIEPNVGMVPIPDDRLDRIANIAKSAKVIYSNMEFVDIAGLVAGAHQGEGLGNQFLGHIRQTQAIAHVVRCFQDGDITHVQGDIDPVRDIQIIDTELCLADMQSLEKALSKHVAKGKSGDKQAKVTCQHIEALLDAINEGPLRLADLSDAQIELAHALTLITIKPVMYVANMDEKLDLSTQAYRALSEYVSDQSTVILPICAKIESELASLPAEEKSAFLEALEYEEPGLNRVIHAGHRLLGLQTYFTAGPKEARAWTVPNDATAIEAAGVIHTDFIKHFIRAEVISYQDFIANNGELGAKAKGLLRLEGKTYRVEDGDVMHFRVSS